MRAAALQFFATPFQLEHNLATAARLARLAAAQGAHIAVLPELFNTGCVYSPRLFAAAETVNGPTLAWLKRLSAELGLHLGGALLLRVGQRIFDAFVLAEPGGKLHFYHKQNPFLWERCYFEAGRGPVVARTPLGRIGLLVCWDIARPQAWAAYRGNVDLLLIAAAPPRLHRAVLNFPLGRKAHLAQLLPGLLRERDRIDGWFEAEVAARAAWLGVPVAQAVMAGRFVTEVPLARLSLLAAALPRPRYWPLVGQAHMASLRATFYGGSAIYNARGQTLARVEGEAGVALAEAGGLAAPNAPADHGSAGSVMHLPPPLPGLPPLVRLLDALLRVPAGVYYRRGASTVATPNP